MINVTGTTKVTRLEVKENYTSGSLYESYKKKNEEGYDTEFVNCVFVGEAHKMISVFPNKTKIKIHNASFRMEKNKYPKVVIFKIEVIEEQDITPVNDGDIPF